MYSNDVPIRGLAHEFSGSPAPNDMIIGRYVSVCGPNQNTDFNPNNILTGQWVSLAAYVVSITQGHLRYMPKACSFLDLSH